MSDKAFAAFLMILLRDNQIYRARSLVDWYSIQRAKGE